LLRVPLNGGPSQVIVSGLANPQSIAIEKGGRVLLVEFGKKRIVGIDASGRVAEVAGNLPIGMGGGERLGVGVGLTVGPSGAIYVTSDVENSIYKLTKL
jgi:glucose/arabinose dehydrogenase